MRYSYTDYTGNGSNKLFSVQFDYISAEHVSVLVDGTSVPFTWTDTNTVNLNTAPASGAKVRVLRTTPKDVALVDFQDASTLTESALDLATKQNLLIAQEADDKANDIVAEAVEAATGAASEVARAVPINSSTDANKVLVAGAAGTYGWSANFTLTPQGYATAQRYYIGDNSYLLYQTANGPAMAFDSSDYMEFDRVQNRFRWIIGGVPIFAILGNLASFGVPLTVAPPTSGSHVATKQYVDDTRMPVGGSGSTVTFSGGIRYDASGHYSHSIRLGWDNALPLMTIDNTVSRALVTTNNRDFDEGRAVTDSGRRIGNLRYVDQGQYLECTVDGSAFAITMSPSDERLKEDIAPSEEAVLPLVRQLSFSDFRYKPLSNTPAGTVMPLFKGGIIAQQVRSVRPEWIIEGTDGVLSLNTTALLTNALKAIQELDAELRDVREQLASLTK